MTPLNLAIVVALTLLHHPHDPGQDAQLANPHQNGGAAVLVIHLITHHEAIFPSTTPQNDKDLPLPPPPIPPRPSSTPPTTLQTCEGKTPPTPPKDKSPKRFLIENRSHPKPSVRLIPDRERRASSASAEDQESSPLAATATTSLSTALPTAEFGVTGAPARGKGRVLTPAGSGVVEELRRVYEERCRIVRTQEPRRKDGPLKASTGRGGMGIGIGRVS